MDRISALRNKWDNAFLKDNIGNRITKILCAVIAAVSVYSLTDISPYLTDVSKPIVMAGICIFAILFYFNCQIAVVFYGAILIFIMSGIYPLLILAAGLLCLAGCNSSYIICLIMIITPACIACGDTALPYFVFSLGIYFISKIGSNICKLIYPVYFTILGFCFGLYGSFINSHEAEYWIDGGFADYEKNWEDIGYILGHIVLIVMLNIIAAYVLYKVFSIKNIKFLSIQTDIRDSVCFAVLIIVFAAEYILLPNFSELSIRSSIAAAVIQIAAAYIISRPFASSEILKEISKRQGEADAYIEQVKKGGFPDICRSAKEEIADIIGTYVDKNKFETIVDANRMPVNAIVIFGKENSCSYYILKNIEKSIKVDITYLNSKDIADEYIKNGHLTCFDFISSLSRLGILFISNVEALFGSGSEALIYEILDSNRLNNKILFIFSTDDIKRVPEEAFGDGRISRVIHADVDSSIVFRDTYALLGVIGQGGSGTVFKAYHRRLNENVVLKKVNITGEKDLRERNEVEILKNIKHTYLPKVYDVFEEDNAVYTVMDYIDGKSMQDISMTGQTFEQKTLVKWLRQLCEAVNYLHKLEKPIIHSDIKPANVMITKNDDICLIDFNISRIFNAQDMSSPALTPGYAPIEQYGNIENYNNILAKYGVKNSAAEGLNDFNLKSDETELICEVNTGTGNDRLADYAGQGITEKTDIYSIGAAFYKLMTGLRPSLDFYSIKPLEMMTAMYSRELIRIIDKCMQINPDDRYENIEGLIDELGNLQS